MCLYEDSDADNAGDARLASDAAGIVTASYQIADDGTISVTITDSGETYTITPADVQVTDSAEANEAGGYSYAQDGTAVFTGLNGTTYYLREVGAPDGYTLNTTEVMVLVTGEVIYANAGTQDGMVTVAQEPGYLVSTLNQASSVGDLDRTLTWAYSKLLVNTQDADTFALDDVPEANASGNWSYLAASDESGSVAAAAYLTYEVADGEDISYGYAVNEAHSSEDGYTGTTRLSTDVGWSSLEVYQDASYYLELLEAAQEADKTLSYDYTEVARAVTSLPSRPVLSARIAQGGVLHPVSCPTLCPVHLCDRFKTLLLPFGKERLYR